MIGRLASLIRRIRSHVATTGGWIPYLRLASAEIRREGLGAKLRRALGAPAHVAAEAGLPALDVRRTGAGRALAFSAPADPQVSIVVPVFNQLALTLECLAAIARHPPRASFELFVIDDGSSDATAPTLGAVPGLRFLRNAANLGFVGSCNAAAQQARGRYLHFLNNDTQVQAGWLDALVEHLERDPMAGLVGSRLVFPDGRLQEAGARVVRAPDGTLAGDLIGLGCSRADPRFQMPREVEYCSGASLLIRRDLFAAVGGFDPGYAPAYFEDVDLAYRVRKAGYRVRYEPRSEVVHHLSASIGNRPEFKRAQIARNAGRFQAKWGEELRRNSAIRLLAFYLPQFHPIPENDRWWGEGFTEWTNVRKARPNFDGHAQPHVPGELGYYDLREPAVRAQQAQLARQHGIHGFCYYYYWFNGKRLLHQPLDGVLASGAPDLPFCVCWANENWTRTWDGRERDVLMAQQHSPDDDLAFIRALLPLFRDARYVRVGGRPLLLVYKVNLLPEPRATAQRWRAACRDAGLGEIYLACVHANASPALNSDPRDIGFDAAVEFPPAGKGINALPPVHTAASFKGLFYDYAATMKNMLARQAEGYVWFRGVMPSWDNTARRQDSAHIFVGSNPAIYGQWLDAAFDWTAQIRVGEERIVFVNAWNEWAEGNHLEPDQKDGRAFLEATRDAVARHTTP